MRFILFFVPENGSSTASISVSQQSVNVSAGKEIVVNGENGYSEGNGKQNSSHDEEIDLQEWYRTCSYLD